MFSSCYIVQCWYSPHYNVRCQLFSSCYIVQCWYRPHYNVQCSVLVTLFNVDTVHITMSSVQFLLHCSMLILQCPVFSSCYNVQCWYSPHYNVQCSVLVTLFNADTVLLMHYSVLIVRSSLHDQQIRTVYHLIVVQLCHKLDPIFRCSFKTKTRKENPRPNLLHKLNTASKNVSSCGYFPDFNTAKHRPHPPVSSLLAWTFV